MAQFIMVKPSRPGLIVLDDLNRRIPYKEDGHKIKRTTLISRSIKEGDLIWVDKPKKKGATPTAPPAKKSKSKEA